MTIYLDAEAIAPDTCNALRGLPDDVDARAIEKPLLERAADLLGGWRQRAADRRHLLALDDGMLRDIGLSRADVELEAGKPFWRG